MKKGDKKIDASRGLKLFRSLVGSKDLEMGVDEIRVKYKKLYKELTDKEQSGFEKDVIRLIRKLKLPNTYWWHKIFTNYIDHNKIIEPAMGHPFIGMLRRVNHLNGGYTEWRFYYGIAQRDLDFLLKQWFMVAPAYVAGTKRKIQPERDPATTERIMVEWSKKQGKGYKEMQIAKKITSEGKRDWARAIKARVYRKRHKTR